MKDIFFSLLALLAVPAVVGGILYMFASGLASIISDWRLGRELEALKRNAPSTSKGSSNTPEQDPLAAFDDEPDRYVEPPAILTIPLEPESAASFSVPNSVVDSVATDSEVGTEPVEAETAAPRETPASLEPTEDPPEVAESAEIDGSGSDVEDAPRTEPVPEVTEDVEPPAEQQLTESQPAESPAALSESPLTADEPIEQAAASQAESTKIETPVSDAANSGDIETETGALEDEEPQAEEPEVENRGEGAASEEEDEPDQLASELTSDESPTSDSIEGSAGEDEMPGSDLAAGGIAAAATAMGGFAAARLNDEETPEETNDPIETGSGSQPEESAAAESEVEAEPEVAEATDPVDHDVSSSWPSGLQQSVEPSESSLTDSPAEPLEAEADDANGDVVEAASQQPETDAPIDSDGEADVEVIEQPMAWPEPIDPYEYALRVSSGLTESEGDDAPEVVELDPHSGEATQREASDDEDATEEESVVGGPAVDDDTDSPSSDEAVDKPQASEPESLEPASLEPETSELELNESGVADESGEAEPRVEVEMRGDADPLEPADQPIVTEEPADGSEEAEVASIVDAPLEAASTDDASDDATPVDVVADEVTSVEDSVEDLGEDDSAEDDSAGDRATIKSAQSESTPSAIIESSDATDAELLSAAAEPTQADSDDVRLDHQEIDNDGGHHDVVAEADEGISETQSRDDVVEVAEREPKYTGDDDQLESSSDVTVDESRVELSQDVDDSTAGLSTPSVASTDPNDGSTFNPFDALRTEYQTQKDGAENLNDDDPGDVDAADQDVAKTIPSESDVAESEFSRNDASATTDSQEQVDDAPVQPDQQAVPAPGSVEEIDADGEAPLTDTEVGDESEASSEAFDSPWKVSAAEYGANVPTAETARTSEEIEQVTADASEEPLAADTSPTTDIGASAADGLEAQEAREEESGGSLRSDEEAASDGDGIGEAGVILGDTSNDSESVGLDQESDPIEDLTANEGSSSEPRTSPGDETEFDVELPKQQRFAFDDAPSMPEESSDVRDDSGLESDETELSFDNAKPALTDAHSPDEATAIDESLNDDLTSQSAVIEDEAAKPESEIVGQGDGAETPAAELRDQLWHESTETTDDVDANVPLVEEEASSEAESPAMPTESGPHDVETSEDDAATESDTFTESPSDSEGSPTVAYYDVADDADRSDWPTLNEAMNRHKSVDDDAKNDDEQPSIDREESESEMAHTGNAEPDVSTDEAQSTSAESVEVDSSIASDHDIEPDRETDGEPAPGMLAAADESVIETPLTEQPNADESTEEAIGSEPDLDKLATEGAGAQLIAGGAPNIESTEASAADSAKQQKKKKKSKKKKKKKRKLPKPSSEVDLVRSLWKLPATLVERFEAADGASASDDTSDEKKKKPRTKGKAKAKSKKRSKRKRDS